MKIETMLDREEEKQKKAQKAQKIPEELHC
jgi:hypothetical protein